MSDKRMTIAVVGPCCAGKSTLVAALRTRGYDARHVAQEHSFAPSMWQKMARPDALIYLDVSYAVAQARRWMNWTESEHAEQGGRLRHARQQADFYLRTDPLTIPEVIEMTLAFLAARPA